MAKAKANARDQSYGYISAAAWGRLHGVPERTVRKWCINSEMRGAFKTSSGQWRMSPDTTRTRFVPPKRDRNHPELYAGIPVSEWATKRGKSRAMAYRHIKDGRVEGAIYTPNGWDVPADAPWPVAKAEAPPVAPPEGNPEAKPEAKPKPERGAA